MERERLDFNKSMCFGRLYFIHLLLYLQLTHTRWLLMVMCMNCIDFYMQSFGRQGTPIAISNLFDYTSLTSTRLLPPYTGLTRAKHFGRLFLGFKNYYIHRDWHILCATIINICKLSYLMVTKLEVNRMTEEFSTWCISGTEKYYNGCDC